MGVILAVPLAYIYEAYLDWPIDEFLHIEEDASNTVGADSVYLFFRVLLGIAFPEELAKLIWPMIALKRQPSQCSSSWPCIHPVDHPYAIIVGAMCAAGGFATIENVMYVLREQRFIDSISTAVVRALVSVPGHMMWTGWAAYHITLWKFGLPRKAPTLLWKAVLKGLGVSMLFHGIFDYGLFLVVLLQDYGLDEDVQTAVCYSSFGVCIMLSIFTYWRMRGKYDELDVMLAQKNSHSDDEQDQLLPNVDETHADETHASSRAI